MGDRRYTIEDIASQGSGGLSVMQFSDSVSFRMNRISSTHLVLSGLLLVGLILTPAKGWAQGQDADRDTTEKGAPYVPTPRYVALKMLTLADVSSDDVVYDLGSGDGRILIMAAKEFGARGVGIEIDSQLVRTARRKARRAGVADQVKFRQEDLFEADLSEATVVTLYLWPDMNNRLRPKLRRELNMGDRVVSHSFDIDGWAADTTVTMETPSPNAPKKTLHRWIISTPRTAQ